MKHFIYILCGVSLFFSCSTLKNNNEVIDVEKNELGFTEFYKILVIPKLKKESFSIKEKKFFDLKIINNGTKNLYIPKWFDLSSGRNSELYIELYKKNENSYEIYKQFNSLVITNNQSNTYEREILLTKNGTTVCINNIELDSFLKIVDEGSYKAKIYIDLSNFGYFKVLETEAFFEVKE
jgi:hypothetical protein